MPSSSFDNVKSVDAALFLNSTTIMNINNTNNSRAEDDSSTLVFNLKIPVPTASATVLSQALDFGKPMKDTTRRFSVCAAAGGVDSLAEASSGILEDYFGITTNNNNSVANVVATSISLVDVTITSTNAKSLRIAVFGLMESLNLSLRTLEMFAHHHNNNNQNQNQQNNEMSGNTNNKFNALMSEQGSTASMMTRRTGSGSGEQQVLGGIKMSPVVGPIHPTSFGGNNLSL